MFFNIPFCRQVNKDCDFLEQERIMDYSMLVGLHFRGMSCSDNVTPPSGYSPGTTTPTGYILSYMDFSYFHFHHEFLFSDNKNIRRRQR